MSHGWPFADCTLHVQLRRKDSEIDLAELKAECESFGNVLKIFPWTSKKSSTPQAYILFDSPAAVQRSSQSVNNRTSRLWKNGYHMLNMCESTTEMLKHFFNDEGITSNDPLFDNIHVNERPNPYASKRRSSLRGEVEPGEIKIPTGPRYMPYHLDHRASSTTSAQQNSSVIFPAKREPLSPKSPGKFTSQRGPPFESSASTLFSTNKGRAGFGKSSPPSTKPIMPLPSPISVAPLLPSPGPDDGDLRQLNMKLNSDIRQLVSDHVDALQKVVDAETETQDLQRKLQSTEEELAHTINSLEAAEAREQTLANQLAKAEFDRDGAQDACTQALAAIKDLLVNQQSAEAAKHRAEVELQQLRDKLAVLELHLIQRGLTPVFSRHTAEIGVQSKPLVVDTEGALRIDLGEAIETPVPAPDNVQYPFHTKLDPHDIPGFLDAFNDIDKLVMGAFSR